MSDGPLVGVVMGSKSDYAVMEAAVDVLREFGVARAEGDRGRSGWRGAFAGNAGG